MPRSSLPLALFFCSLLVVSIFAPQTSSQSTLRSLLLNGSTAYAEVPNHTSLNISGAITVEAWIKVNAIDGSHHDIVSRIDRNTAGSGGGYAIGVNGAGKVRLDLFQSHNTYTTVIGTTLLNAGAWHHVAGVFSGSQMRVYVNGVLDGSLNTANGPVSGTSLLRIGRAAHANGPPLYLPSYAFAGLIDEVRVSAAALYTSNFTPGLGPGSNVRGLWKFDGQTATDSSGNNNNGALVGGATYATDVPPAANNAPAVSLVHPLNNTAIAAGANIVMDATATDSDGSVAKVDFYQGTTLLGTDTTAPYTFTWTNVPVGSYSLTATATDDGNASTTSSGMAVSVQAAGGKYSLSLNGTTAYAEAPNHTSLNITGPLTVEAWVKVNAIDGNQHDIVSRIDRNTAGSGGGYAIGVNGAGKVRLDLFQSYNTYTTVIGTSVLNAGAWYHVAGVFSGSQIRVYVNGVLDGSLNTTNGPASGTSLLRIGRAAHANGPPLYLPSYAFAGLIDEVRVSAAALYTSNFTPGLGPGANVRGLWQFDGETPNDFSGNGNHATLQGGAGYSTNVPVTGGPQRPVAVAGGPYSGQLAQSVQFSSSGSFDPDGSVASYHWNFGDGTSSTSANPAHSYAAPGLYTATLTVTDNSGLLASATAPVTISSNGVARLDPMNQTGGGGENPLSRNFAWSLPLVSLPGRAGMDLGISLSYNSLVWTRSGNYITFDDDRGFPGPGFRLGFPVIQPLYYNSEVGKYAFLLISPDGSRTELRQVGSSALFEAADSSYLLLDSNTMVLRTSDGTQLTYVLLGNEFNCTQIKDSNGNYLTINYTPFGRLDTVSDTLARSIKFNYDANGWLTAITQIWNQGSPGQVTHNWATFTYANTTIQTTFTGLTVSGPANGAPLKNLAKVTLADGSHSDFSYTSWGQVWKVSTFASDNHQLNYRAYKLPGSPLLATSPQTDCPRFTERRDWAQYWNGDTDGTSTTNEEVVTHFAEPVSDTWTMPNGTQQSGTRAQVTMPDGASNKIYFIGTAGTASGWRRSLPALVNTYDSAGVLQRQAMTTWTQDNTSVAFLQNPRVTETNVYDPAGNRARTEVTYQQFTFANGTSCQLPRDLYEYAANASTKLRSTRTDYNTSTSYTDRRIIGLVSEKRLYEGDVNSGGVLASKVAFSYDESGSIQGTDAPVQHDNTSYTASFVAGRGNLSSVKQYDVTNTSNFTTTSSKFNTAGAVVSSRDPSNHEVVLSYADSFSDNNNSRNTLAYATTVIDAEGYSSSAKYHFDFGAITYQRTPQPNLATNTPGPERFFAYDAIGRPQALTNSVNSASTSFVYTPSQNRVDILTTIEDGLGAARRFMVADGHGRVIGVATDHPGSIGGYSGQKWIYDVFGNVIKMSNPAETSAGGPPTQWTTAGDDAAGGWIYTEQTYDWKGRPLVTTNPSVTNNPTQTTTRQLSYTGCGCAGGEVVTVTDEGTLDASGVTRKRQQKIYSDVLGRTTITESLNWDGAGPNGTGGSVYSSTAFTYNARDQIMVVRRHAGPTSSPTFQEATASYDGFGRLKTQHLPHQKIDVNNSASTDHTTWNYNNDGAIQSVVDPRGVITNFTYNARHLPTAVSFDSSSLPSSANVTSNTSIALAYDAMGNRTSMSDGSGAVNYHFDQHSRMDWEERSFAGLPNAGTFRLNYEYSLGGILKKVTDQRSGTSFTETLDKVGRVTAVSAVGLGGAQTQFISQAQYRAWGALKSRSQGSTTLSYTYNQRLLVATYALGAQDVSYEYHHNGMIKFANDETGFGDIKDRAYTYDAVGRLQQAYSGVEARNYVNNTSGGTPDGPYRQAYTYDPWGNLLQSTGRFWSRDADDLASFFDTADRNPDWSYDANGNLLSRNEPATTMTPFQPARYKFDAAGRELESTQTRTYFISGEGIVTYAFLNSKTFDGDNQLTHYLLTRNTTINSFTSTVVTGEAYLLRSTVLGGRAISEYKGDGTWSKTHVYAGGERLGEQTAAEGGSAVSIWESVDPVTGDVVKQLASGSNIGSTTMDPGGVDVGDSDPFPVDGSGDADGLADPGELGKTVSSLIPSEGGGSKCILDGLEIQCQRISGNSSVQCPNNDCGTRTVTVSAQSNGRFVGSSTFIAPTWWDDSLDGTYSVSSEWAGGFSFGTSEGGLAFISELSWRSAMGGDSELFERNSGNGTAQANHHASGLPQNLLNRSESDTIQDSVNRGGELLSNRDCFNFINGLLQRAAAVVSHRSRGIGQGYLDINGFYPGVGAVISHNNYANLVANGGVTASRVSGRNGNIVTYGVTVVATGEIRWNTEFFSLGRDERGRHTIHEGLHQFTGFDDQVLANAARATLRLDPRDFSTEPNPSGAASIELNRLITQECRGL